MTLPLIEKYRAKTFQEIIGQDLAIKEIQTFFKSFPLKKALVLSGPVGTGKTSLAIALAKENNLELFELNASDLRNRKSLEEVLKPSLEQQSLFKKGKLILMDEADGITATDRGGLPELIALITKTKYPIIITANDIWQKKFSGLRQKCKIISLKELKDNDIQEIINNILNKENKKLDKETIDLIIKNAKGDVRAALNDLQTVFDLGVDALKTELSEREKAENVFNILKTLFQEPVSKETLRLFDNLDINLDEVLLWIEENLPLEYQGKALAKAFDSLSRADVFRGRIYRQQYWRFLVYQSFFQSAGVSAATLLKNKKFTSYKRPSRILKIWLANQKNAKKKSITAKYAKLCHMSKKKANKENFLLPLIITNIDDKTKTKLDLDEKELEYLQDRKGAIIIANELNRFRG
jgi:replication factor C large subunit